MSGIVFLMRDVIVAFGGPFGDPLSHPRKSTSSSIHSISNKDNDADESERISMSLVKAQEQRESALRSIFLKTISFFHLTLLKELS